MNQKREIIKSLIVIAVSIFIILVSNKIFEININGGKNKENFEYPKAKVLKVNKEMLTPDPNFKNIKLGYQDIEIEILNGKYKNQKFNIRNSVSRMYNIRVKEGMTVIAGIYTKDGEISDTAIYSYRRGNIILILILILFAVMIAVGNVKGLKSFTMIFFDAVMILYLTVPLAYKGLNPILSSILTAIIIAALNMFMINGKSKKTNAAIISTVTTVIISAMLSYIFGLITHLSGITMDKVENIMYIAENTKMSISGFIFMIVIITYLGIIMDVVQSTLTSIFNEYNHGNSDEKNLFLIGMDSGKTVFETKISTIIFGFLGFSFIDIILMRAVDLPFNQLINMDIIGTSLIQLICGCIGIIIAVPITSWVSVKILKNN